MDQDGFVYFRQRIKRMIITSGYNVPPLSWKTSSTDTRRSCFLRHWREGRLPGPAGEAYVVPMPGVEPTEELKKNILDYCSHHIAKGNAMPRELGVPEGTAQDPGG